jgi:uncharacterized protein YuzE
MKISYDPKADALYIKLNKGKIDESDEIAEGIIVDYDSKRKPLGIEILDAARLFGGHKAMQVELALTEEIKK